MEKLEVHISETLTLKSFDMRPPGVHRQGHDMLVAERRALPGLSRDARVDGVVGVLMIPF